MGFEMKITGSDGRRYNNMADMFEAEGKRLIDDHVSAVERAICSQRCSVHGEYAKATRQPTSKGVHFKISGCCDELVERAQAAAGRVAPDLNPENRRQPPPPRVEKPLSSQRSC